MYIVCVLTWSLLGVQKIASATPRSVSFRGLIEKFRRASPPLSYAESPPGNRYMCLVRIYIIEKFNVVIVERVSLVGALLECLFFLCFQSVLQREWIASPSTVSFWKFSLSSRSFAGLRTADVFPLVASLRKNVCCSQARALPLPLNLMMLFFTPNSWVERWEMCIPK